MKEDKHAAPVNNHHRLRRIRPAPQPQLCCEQQSKVDFKDRKDEDETSVVESDRRRRRRESDARCRANLSSCFSFLKSQVQDENESEVKMSKEALLYHSIDQIQYLEAILVLLQQTKETSQGTTPSLPVEVLQDIHKEFISKKHGIEVEQLSLSRNIPENSQRVTRNTVSDSDLQPNTSKQAGVGRQKVVPTTPLNNPTAATVKNKSCNKRTVPNILSKKSDTKTPTKNQRCKQVSKQNKAQQVPGTPTYGDRSGIDDHGRLVHEVPCTPTKAINQDHHLLENDLPVKRYRIKGKDITPSKLKDSLNMCNDCQIQDACCDTDLNCYEDPGDWSPESFEKLLHTPQRDAHGGHGKVFFRTSPKMKRKSLTLPTPESDCSGKRSRKCLFKNKPKRDTKKTKRKTKKVIKESSPAKKSRYFKRATAARTRAWDPVAMKVASPFQPYSGIYGQRKKSKMDKATTKLVKRSCKSQKKITKAIIDHTNISRFIIASTKDTLALEAEDAESKCSQDSLSIDEVPSLPPNICKLISRGGEFYLNEVNSVPNTSKRFSNISSHDEGSPFETCPGNNSFTTEASSMESLPKQQQGAYFDSMSQGGFQNDSSQQGGFTYHSMSHGYFQNDSMDDYEQIIAVMSPSPTGDRAIDGGSVSSDPCFRDGRRATERELGEEDHLLSSQTDSQGLSSLDGLIRRNVWQGNRNQDITLAQLQRQPIFGTDSSVYRSPQWLGTMTDHLQACSKDIEWVDVETSDSGPAISSGQQDSWDTVDFLSSIGDGSSGQSHFSRSSSQNSSDSNFSVILEPGCATARAIEEYQVVPHYRPEE